MHGESELRARGVFLAAFALMCYGTGAGLIESFVNYPSWALIGPAEFRAYHQFISPRVIAYLVAPIALGSACTLLLLWSRPRAVPLWMVCAAIALQIATWVSTATIQIPIQVALSSGGQDLALLDRLSVTNFWYRRVPMSVNSVLFVWMALRVLRDGAETRARAESPRVLRRLG